MSDSHRTFRGIAAVWLALCCLPGTTNAATAVVTGTDGRLALEGVRAHVTTPAATPRTDRPRRAFVVAVKRDGEWLEAGSIPCNRFYAARSLDLRPHVTDGLTMVRVVPRNGGRAHIDAATLGGGAPTAAPASDLAKLQAVDHDVVEAPPEGLELVFPATASGSAVLELNARIEPTVIGTEPFQFPPQNTFRETSVNSAFYTYHLGSSPGRLTVDGDITDETLGEPLFAELIPCGSGHPQGFTYGWVHDDHEHLYVAFDFTPDNTRDGDADYAEVFVERGGELLTYRVTASDQRWGRVGFGPTERAAYRHKTYELALPLDELLEPGCDHVRVAFATYGTASPGASGNDILAFEPRSQTYAVVYWEVPAAYELRVQLYDASGAAVGGPATVFSGSDTPTAAVAADPSHSVFLVAWADGPTARILGRLVYPDGTLGPGPAEISDVQMGDGPTAPRLAFDVERQRYLVVWLDSRAGTWRHVYGRFVGADGAPQGAGSFNIDDDAVNIHADKANLGYSSDDDQFLVVWETQIEEVFAQRINAINGSALGSSIPISTATDRSGIDVAFSQLAGSYLVPWTSLPTSQVVARVVLPDGTTGGAEQVLITGSEDLNHARLAAHPTVPRFLVAALEPWVPGILARWVDANHGVPVGNQSLLSPAGVYPSGLGVAADPRNHCTAAATYDDTSGGPLLVFANGIRVTGDPATTSELGHTATLGISLCTEPSDKVQVDVVSENPEEGTVSPNQLIFTTDNWAVEQEVVVTPVQDPHADGPVSYLVILTVDDAGAPDDYDGIVDAAVVTNYDVDVLFFDGFESGTTSAWSGVVP